MADFIAPEPGVEPPKPAAPAPADTGGGFVAPESVEDTTAQAANDDKFDPTGFYIQSGKTPEAHDFAARVLEHRAKNPKPTGQKIAGVLKGIGEEVGNTGADIWHTLPGTAPVGEAKSGIGSFVQSLAGAGFDAVRDIVTSPRDAGFFETEGNWLKRTKEKIDRFDALTAKQDEERRAYIATNGTAQGFTPSPGATIPKDDVVTPEDRAEYDTWAARAIKGGATLQRGAMHGGETLIKAKRLFDKESGFTLDQWKDRLSQDAALHETADDLAHGKVDRSNPLTRHFSFDVPEEDRERLIAQGTLRPEEIEKESAVADPTNILLMEGLRLPIFNKAVGAGLKLSGKGMEFVSGVADHLVGKGGAKVLKGGLVGAGGFYALNEAFHGDLKPIGAAVALLGARLVLGRGGKLISEAGDEMLNPEAFNSRSAMNAAKTGALEAEAGTAARSPIGKAAENFVDGADNSAAASRIARRTVQGVGTGVAGAVPFAALADTPEEAGKAIGGGAAFGAVASPLHAGLENPTLNRAMEINKAATRMLADRGAAVKLADTALQQKHEAAVEDLNYTTRTYMDALKGLVSGFKGKNGQNMNVAVLEKPDFAAEVAKRSGAAPDEVGNAHAYFDPESGTVFVNKGNLRVDSAGHEAGHFISEEVMRQMGKAYGSALRNAVEGGLFEGGKPTPEFQRFIDAYNAKTPGVKIPSDQKANPGDILRHRAVSEYLAETTRAILGEPHVGRFMLPKDVSDRLADNLTRMYGDAAAGKKGLDLFQRTDIPTINKAVKDVLFDLGRGMKPDPSVSDTSRSTTPADGSKPAAGTAPATPGAAPNPAKANKYADIGIDEGLVDSVRDYHISPPGMEPRTQRTNKKRGVEGKSADRIAEERGQEWDDMFSKYVAFLRAHGLEAPKDPLSLHQAVLEHYLKSDAGARPDLAAASTRPAGAPALAGDSGASIETKSELTPSGALATEAPEIGRPALSEEPGREPSPVHTEEEVNQRVTDAENTAVQSPEYARKRTDVTRADHVHTARVGELLKVSTEHAEQSGDQSLLQRRTDPEGGERYTGRLDPENIPAHRILLQELGIQPDGQATIDLLNDKVGQTVFLDYNSAPKGEGAEGDISGKQRRQEYAASSAEDRRTGGAGREQKGKAFHILGFKVWPKKGTVTLFGFSPDKWIANAGKLLTHLQGEGVETGYAGVNDPQLTADMQGYVRNHENGYKGDGSGAVEGRHPEGEPYQIPRNRFDVLNAALNFDISTKGGSKREGTQRGALEAQERAEANDWGVDPETGDTNPLRAYVNKSGKLVTPDGTPGTGANLENVYEHLAPDLVTGISDAPVSQDIVRPVGFEGNPGDVTRKGIPNREYAEGGFMPDSGALSSIGTKKDNLGFFSGLRRTVEAKIPNRASVEQIKATLDPSKGGVKKEELQVMGLPQFLEGKTHVTKAELLDFIDANSIKLDEVVKGTGNASKEAGWTAEQFQDAIAAAERRRDWDEAERLTAIHEDLELGSDANDTGNQTKFSKWKTPGGDNYTERLLTLPESEPSTQGWTATENPKRPGPRTFTVKDATGQVVAEGMAGGSPEEAIAYAASREVAMKPKFTGTHWDEPNVVVHTREQDFTDAGGASVRLIEEIQSDWHQKGRKEGYAGEKVTRDKEAAAEAKRKADELLAGRSVTELSPEEQAEWNRLTGEAHNQNAGTTSGVPDGPFKKSWHELGFKRALAEAVAAGKDKIAWITGETAADRFDLSKQVDKLTYWKNPDGTFGLYAYEKSGNRVLGEQKIPAEKLPDMIGKEMAQRIAETAPSEGDKTISGDDLKVGGEGMKGFYDKILPDFVRKYVKPWGGKVETTTLNGRVKPYEVRYDNGNGENSVGFFETRKEAIAKVRELGEGATILSNANPALRKGKDVSTVVHSVTITPEMRKAIGENGQAMFMPDSSDASIGTKKGGALADVDNLGFYSGVGRIVDAKIPNRASGDQILATLKSNGAKAEELDSLGLAEFLKTQSGPVSKKDVQDFIKSGGVQLREVQRRNGDAENDAIVDAAMNEDWQGVQANADRANAVETKYDSYTLKGGTNYKEVLLTLPERGRVTYTPENVIPLPPEHPLSSSQPNLFWYFKTPDNVLQIPKRKYATEEAARDYIIREKQPEAPVEQNYQTPHWDDKNVLAHIRQADHTDTEGNAVRLIEELQSDWHQKGCKEGYRGEKEAELNRLLEERKSPDEATARAAQDRINQLGVGPVGVPDAPFKKTWAELAFKRALRMAVEDGVDKVAWVTGEIAAQRFDISKQVDEVVYYPETQDLQGFKGGNEVIFHKNVPKEKLGDFIGKEAADRLINNPTEKSPAKGGGENLTLKGEDLKVGGAGMKGFYDKILPDFVRRYVKKWGGKVETSRIVTREAGDPSAPLPTFDEWHRRKYGEDFGALTPDGDARIAEYREELDRLNETPETKEVHSVAITPEMRKAIMEGQPMFMPGSGTKRPALADTADTAPPSFRGVRPALADDDRKPALAEK